MHRALAVLAFGLVVFDPGAGWTQQGHRHRAPGDAPDPFETQVNTFTLGNQGDPAMANNQLGDGQAIVVWSSEGQDGSGLGVYGRGIGPAGFPEFRVNSYTTGDQHDASVAIRDFSGLYANFVVVWSSLQDGSGKGVFGQRFMANGAPVGPEFRVNTFTT